MCSFQGMFSGGEVGLIRSSCIWYQSGIRQTSARHPPDIRQGFKPLANSKSPLKRTGMLFRVH
ncbi:MULTISPECIES: hypothetical protein [Cyanophyceae]|uniref:hypothetical protein n=1 Tax=Cyanophyceae TaxID=3028117 RepID=UPI0016844685|nr:hypothetical protein [Trichocoleus sp. FACHB-832]MBD1904395.1 hypothetical protein [Trichocoleus sp. FACHB-832]